MDGEHLKKIVPKWAKELGEEEAKLVLIRAGIGYTTALFLIQGTYKSTPKDRLIGLLKVVLADYINRAS